MKNVGPIARADTSTAIINALLFEPKFIIITNP
jgi:hypothetical protein